MTRSCGRVLVGKASQNLRGAPLGLPEHLPQNQNLSVLLFHDFHRLVITFLPRSKRLLISWLQSPSSFCDPEFSDTSGR